MKEPVSSRFAGIRSVQDHRRRGAACQIFAGKKTTPPQKLLRSNSVSSNSRCCRTTAFAVGFYPLQYVKMRTTVLLVALACCDAASSFCLSINKSINNTVVKCGCERSNRCQMVDWTYGAWLRLGKLVFMYFPLLFFTTATVCRVGGVGLSGIGSHNLQATSTQTKTVQVNTTSCL